MHRITKIIHDVYCFNEIMPSLNGRYKTFIGFPEGQQQGSHMLNQIFVAISLFFVAFVKAEADGRGCTNCHHGRRGKDGPMGLRGPNGTPGLPGAQGANGEPGDATNRLSLGLYRTDSGNILPGDLVPFTYTSWISNTGFTVNEGTVITILQNATYVVTYTVDAGSLGPLYFQLELNGVYVPNSLYGLNECKQQIIGRALVDVPEPGMNLTLKCNQGNAAFKVDYEGQNNASINIIRVGYSGLN